MLVNPLELMESGLTTRYHIYPVGLHQPVSAHSWGVALLLDTYFPDASKALIVAAIKHDMGEKKSGDCPHLVKKAHPEIRRLTQMVEDSYFEELGVSLPNGLTVEEHRRLKWADMAECALHVMHIHNETNSAAALVILKNALAVLKTFDDLSHTVAKVNQFIEEAV